MDLFTLLTGSNLRIEIYYGFWIKKKSVILATTFRSLFSLEPVDKTSHQLVPAQDTCSVNSNKQPSR